MVVYTPRPERWDRVASTVTEQRIATTWIWPIANTLKVNWDAAIFSSNGRSGLGWVVWDHAGKLLRASTRLLLGILAPDTAEAMSVREVLQRLCPVIHSRSIMWKLKRCLSLRPLHQQLMMLSISDLLLLTAEISCFNVLTHRWTLSHDLLTTSSTILLGLLSLSPELMVWVFPLPI